MSNDPNRLITLQEAEKVSGRSIVTLRQHCAEGKLQYTMSEGSRPHKLVMLGEVIKKYNVPDTTTEKAPTAKDMIALKEGFQQALKKRDDIIKDLQDRLSKQEAYMLEVCKEVYKGRINLVENQND